MATLREYFEKLGPGTFRRNESFQIRQDGQILGEVRVTLHHDFEAGARYVSFYVEHMADVECPEAIVLSELDSILFKKSKDLSIVAGLPGEMRPGNKLPFTGKVYIYSESPVSTKMKYSLSRDAERSGLNLVFRSEDFVKERNRLARPQAFICHDSRDKEDIAQPLALELQNMMCLVWYDEFSLRVGDSLRAQIEKGLKECPKCILIVTPRFLDNQGWAKREFDSIFTRELVEKKGLILPVWHQITKKDVFNYSPTLADRVAVDWQLGEAEVARRLMQAMDS